MSHALRIPLLAAGLSLISFPQVAVPATWRVPADRPTIQEGLNAAAGGDTVLVAPGTYAGPGNTGLNFHGKAVVLLSEAGAALTVIDGESEAASAIAFDSAEPAGTIVDGFTITGFHSEDMSPILVRHSSPTLTRCVIAGNRGRLGGGVLVFGASPSLVDCELRGNTASIEGGGLYSYRNSTLNLTRCLIVENSAPYAGGLHLERTDVTMVGCTVTGNHADSDGGGILLPGDESPYAVSIERSILWGNTSGGVGPAIYTQTTAVITVTCSLFDPSEVENAETIDFSGPQVDADPLFCVPEYTVDDDSPCTPEKSPCGMLIGARDVGCEHYPGGACCLLDGRCEFLLETVCAELEGAYQGSEVPCDPYPCPPAACCYPSGECVVVATPEACETAGGCFRPGTVCEPATCAPSVWRVPAEYSRIQSAIDYACSGDSVLLAPGIYTGAGNRDLDLQGKALVLRSEQGADLTVIDCEHEGRGFYIHRGEPAETVIEGITISGGRDSEAGSVGGGGILITNGSAPTIRSCRFLDNESAAFGGAIAWFLDPGTSESRPLIESCEFLDNHATGSDAQGGAVYLGDASPRFEGCTFAGNSAVRGGAVAFQQSSSSLVSCTMTANSALQQGGAVYASGALSPFTLDRTILWGNCAGSGGKDIFNYSVEDFSILCCDLNPDGVAGPQPVSYVGDQVFSEPLFCASVTCTESVEDADLSLAENSPCTAEASPCGERIGAREVACSPLPTGSCCFLDGSCLLTTSYDCDLRGGSFQNEETCDPNPCPQPGPCCLDDGRCTVLLGALCLTGGGEPGTPGGTCSPNPCSQPGACCEPDGPCTIHREVNCEGSFLGELTTCDPLHPCAGPQTGACCFPFGPCTIETGPDCSEAGGAYLGDGENCDVLACEFNRGATLFLHADPAIEYTGSERDYLSEFALGDCGQATTRIEGGGTHVFFVAAEIPERSVARFTDVSFGLWYDASKVDLVAWGTTADAESTVAAWPSPGTGTRIGWTQPREEALVPLYWFAASFEADSETTIQLIPHPELGTGFGDDLHPGIRTPVVCLGSLGYGTDGFRCCGQSQSGACCFEDGSCAILGNPDCAEAGGEFQGGESCAPFGCFPVGACCSGYLGDICQILPQKICESFDPWRWDYHLECYASICIYPAVQVSEVSVVQRELHVEISWRASSDVGLSQFVILRSESPEGAPVALATLETEPGAPLRFADQSVQPGRRYYYWLEGVEITGSTNRLGPYEIELIAPASPVLLSQAPNPLRDEVTLRFFLPQARESALRIYDPGGRSVRTIDLGVTPAGTREVVWDRRDSRGEPVARGVYYFRIEAGTTVLRGRPLIVF